MGKNVILPEQTVRDLLEAYASLAAWYYQLWAAVRGGNATADPPNEAARAAFVQRLVQDHPELAMVAATLQSPRNVLPPPPALPAPVADLDRAADEAATFIEPAPARLRERMNAPDGPPSEATPPSLVAPGSVRYPR